MPTKMRRRQPARKPRELRKILLISGQPPAETSWSPLKPSQAGQSDAAVLTGILILEVDRWRNPAIILIDGGRESVGVGTFSEGLRADYFGRCSSVNASHLGCKAKPTQGMNRF